MAEFLTTVLNPHGSDETEFKSLLIVFPHTFLTHTVQMKLKSLLNSFLIKRRFLTHTVQMKPKILGVFLIQSVCS